MPPQQSSARTDPNIVEGPRKCRPPAHFADNGDPPVAKKKVKRGKAGGGHESESTRSKSVSIEDTSNTRRPHPAPTLTNRSLDDGSDASCRSGTPKLTDVETTVSERSDKDEEPEEEDDITELSMFGVFPLS